MKTAALIFFYYGLLSCQASVMDVRLGEACNGTLKLSQTKNPGTCECDTTNWQQVYISQTTLSYADIKDNIGDTLESLKENHQLVGKVFANYLVHQLIPHWYGTPWAFEGYTAIPNQGNIACGYFVSTTLLHMGLNVNRYKLAQQLPIHEALSIAGDDTVSTIEIFTESNRAEVLLEACPDDGIYFIGFDQSHVGYLYRSGSCSYVIHSDYLTAGAVSIESALNSPVLEAFSRYYIAPISTNEWLMNCWLNGEEIEVIETPDA